MNKFFKFCAAALFAFCTLPAAAQDAPQEMPLNALPVDQAVRVGTLPNGLTYYIRHNETPKGQADFYIAQKVGSILEEDNQRGLAHFLEHMCFNGTENFPGKGIINWLESIGVKFGQNLNAYTSVDETVYNISAVPVARQSVQDSCLLILHDWANALTLDPAEIDAERGVIHEEWRRSMAGQMRILENILPTIYPDNKYGYRLPIGIMEVVDNFPPQAITDYYHTWYRPDQQGIIVVGDIDPDYIEGKIKEMFSPIKMPENAKERYYVPVEDTPGTIYAIGSDPEQAIGLVSFMFKFDSPFTREQRNSVEYLTYSYIEDIITTMLENRLREIAKTADAPFAHASFGIGDFLLSKTKKAVELDIIAKGNDALPGLEAAYRELLRAVRGGFTQGEFDRANAEYRSDLQKKFDARNNTPTEDYSKLYVDAFVDNEPIPGIEVKKQILDLISQSIPLQAINSLLPEIITADNRVLMVAVPQNDTFQVPTEEQLAAVIAAVDAETIEPYKDEMRTDPLIPNLAPAGTITSEQHIDKWNATEYTLSNGVKVIVKPTEFKANEVYFTAMAPGGYSAEPDEMAATVQFFPYATSTYGLGDYSNNDIKKYLQGKQVELELDVKEYDRSLDGHTTVADLPVLMELIHAYFTEFNLKEDEFAATQNMIKGILGNQESTPQYMFGKLYDQTVYASPLKQAISSAAIDKADRQATVDLARKMLANPTDYTFVFVGNIDMATFKPLMEQYLANLPVGQSVKYTHNHGVEIALGANTVNESMAMQTPQTWVYYMISDPTEYSVKNRVVGNMAAQILSKRLLDKVREEMGATYSIGAYGSLSRTGNNNYTVHIPFPMKPEMRAEALAAIDTILAEMAQNVTEAELAPVREFMVKEAREDMEENEDWAKAMAAMSLNGVETFTNAEEVAAAVTVDDVMNFWRKVLADGNRQLILLNPAE